MMVHISTMHLAEDNQIEIRPGGNHVSVNVTDDGDSLRQFSLVVGTDAIAKARELATALLEAADRAEGLEGDLDDE